MKYIIIPIGFLVMLIIKLIVSIVQWIILALWHLKFNPEMKTLWFHNQMDYLIEDVFDISFLF